MESGGYLRDWDAKKMMKGARSFISKAEPREVMM
jgi:hypothetical protein